MRADGCERFRAEQRQADKDDRRCLRCASTLRCSRKIHADSSAPMTVAVAGWITVPWPSGTIVKP